MQGIGARFGVVAVVTAAIAIGAGVEPARAATAVHPDGGSTFSGDLEGWQVTGAACNVALLCGASGGWEGADGDPAGSLAADTTVLLNLLSVFSSEVSFESPEFTVLADGPTTFGLDHRFAPGNLLNLGAELEYTVRLLDKTEATEVTLLTETLAAETGWSRVEVEVEPTMTPGHVYAVAIGAVTTSSLVNLAIAGTSSARFDDVALTVEEEEGEEEEGEGGDPGDEGGPGGGGGADPSGDGSADPTPTSPDMAALITESELRSLVSRTVVNRVWIRGNRVFVKAKCLRRAGGACRFSLQGLLGKGRPATTRRNVRIGKGQGKRVVLRIRPDARRRVAKRNRLLFKQTMRVGKAQTTVYRNLKLIRRTR